MKIRYLMASMLVCLVGFSSCGSDGDEPTPDISENAGLHTMVVEVKEPGMIRSIFEKTCFSWEKKGLWADTLILKGPLNGDDIWGLSDVRNKYYDKVLGNMILDISEIQLVESEYNGKHYPANHLYGDWGQFSIFQFPKNIKVIENVGQYYHTIFVTNLFKEGLLEIKKEAFRAAKLAEGTEIVFPKSLKKIEENAFSGATNLKKIKTMGNVDIEKNAFSSVRLESVELNGVERIKEGIFEDCIYDEDDKMVISIPDVKYIERDAFKAYTRSASSGDGELEIKNPKNLIEIGDNAFAGLAYVKGLSGAINLQKIGSLALSHLSEDCEIIIPENVKELGYSVFGRPVNKEVHAIHMRPKFPPKGESYSLCDTLYVPKGSKNYYEKAGVYDRDQTSCGIACKILIEE